MKQNATERKHADNLRKHGYELVYNRDEGYYYLTRLNDDAPQIREEGLYGRNVPLMTIEDVERELLERIKDFKS